jgi:hypothetical protein
MNGLIGIRTTDDILQFKDEIYANETELKRVMALYEDCETDEAPQLKPMKVNWKVVNGRWNEDLFLQFVAYAEEQGYAEGKIDDDDEDELREMFYARINRMFGVINANRPKPKESPQKTEKRVQDRKKEVLRMNRRNTRRREVGIFIFILSIADDNDSYLMRDSIRFWRDSLIQKYQSKN